MSLIMEILVLSLGLGVIIVGYIINKVRSASSWLMQREVSQAVYNKTIAFTGEAEIKAHAWLDEQKKKRADKKANIKQINVQ